MRVLCAGHVNWDVTLRVDALPEPDGEARVVERGGSGGGSAANAASVLSALDVSAGVLGSVGADRYGRQARRELVDAGVDVSALVETSVGTATKYLVVDPDGAVMVVGSNRGNEAFGVEDVPEEVLTVVDHVHLTSQRPGTAGALARLAREAEATVSVDPGRRVGDREHGPVTSQADLLFVTDHEATRIGVDPTDPNDGLDGRAVVVTFGAAGAEVRTDGRCHRHEGFDVDAVDTAGAGDAFAGGFLATLLTGWDPDGPDSLDRHGGVPVDTGAETYDRALRVGNACGAVAARQSGARVRVSRTDVRRFLARR